MMDDLGNNYLDTGHYPERSSSMRDLIVRDKVGRHCVVSGAHHRSDHGDEGAGNKDPIVKEVEQPASRSTNEFKSGWYSAEQKGWSARTRAAGFSRPRRRWRGTSRPSARRGQRGTGDLKTMALAAHALQEGRRHLERRRSSRTFQFPRIVKEDWPTIYKIKYAMADLAVLPEGLGEVRSAPFDSRRRREPARPPRPPRPRTPSVLCYQNIYDETHKDGSAKKGAGNPPGQKTDEEVRQEGAADDSEKLKPKEMLRKPEGHGPGLQSVHLLHQARGRRTRPAQEQLVEVKYARARTYFEAQHWEEAAIGFRDIAMNHSDRDVGIYAAQLYLESVNVLGSNFQKTSCFDDMGADVPEVHRALLPGRQGDEERRAVHHAQQDPGRYPSLEGAEARRARRQGRRQGRPRSLRAGRQRRTSRCSASTARIRSPTSRPRRPSVATKSRTTRPAPSRRRCLVAKAITVRRSPRVRREDQRLNSPLAKKARYEIGGNYQAIAVYDLAAELVRALSEGRSEGRRTADTGASPTPSSSASVSARKRRRSKTRAFTKSYGDEQARADRVRSRSRSARTTRTRSSGTRQAAPAGSMGVIDRRLRCPGSGARDLRALLTPSFRRVRRTEAQGEYARVRSIWNDPRQQPR